MCGSAKPVRLGANPAQWSIYGAVYVSIGRFNCMSMHAVELWSTLKLSKKLNGEDSYLAAA